MTGLRVTGVDLRALMGLNLTDHQLAAATAPLEPGVIVAGAGSGKTTVMAARVVHLVATGAVAPERVLGLTFTTKGAGELGERVRAALLRAGLATPGDGDAGEPTVSTYHAHFGRLVGEHALRLGLEPRSRLLADATRFQLAGRVLRRHRGTVDALTRPLTMLIGELVSLESELSEHLVDPAELIACDATWELELLAELAALDGLPRVEGQRKELLKMVGVSRQRRELARLAVDLRAAKRDLDAVDFGDQVSLAARLAEECPEVGAAERERWGVVLLDEYQDTSVAQRRALAALFGGGHPVTAVGDPCQAIYGWRGASVANLDRFGEHFPRADGRRAGRSALPVNQRSGGRLLQLANRVVATLRTRHDVVELTPRPGHEQAGATVVALHRAAAEEIAWVAGQLAVVVRDGVAPAGECAVLVRARSDFAALHAALIAVGLPVEVVGLGGLLTVPEVADVVATLEVLDDPTANAALLRLLTGPRWRVGPRDLAALGERARRLLVEPGGDAGSPERGELDALEEAVAGVDPCDVTSLAEACASPGGRLGQEGRRRVVALAGELRTLRGHVDEPLLDLVGRVVALSGLDVELAARPEQPGLPGGASLAAFLDVVAGFADLDGEQSLPSFLAFLRAAEEHDRGLDAATPASGRDAVQLLTAHRAKGLEWDVVAVPDLTAGVFPVSVVRARWTTTASVLPAPLRGDAEDQPVARGWTRALLAEHKAACDEHLERDERRLGYVAFTRPRHLLIASGHWWGPTQVKRRGPSPFLLELREHAEAGSGTVARWEPKPAEERNPALELPSAVAWPALLAEAPLAARQEAAAEVRAGVAALAAGSPAVADEAGLTPAERTELERLDRDTELLLAEARRERDPVREVALPRTLTASQVLRLRADPDGLARELARPLPRPPAPAARRGTRFHAWVETLFAQRPLLGPDELPGAADDGAADDADLAALQRFFLASPWATRAPLAVEAPFAVALADQIVRGRIDAVYDLGDGRYEVVDWKTGTEPADPLQLAVYRTAWARSRGVPESAVDAAFLAVRTGEVIRPRLPGVEELEALLRGPAA